MINLLLLFNILTFRMLNLLYRLVQEYAFMRTSQKQNSFRQLLCPCPLHAQHLFTWPSQLRNIVQPYVRARQLRIILNFKPDCVQKKKWIDCVWTGLDIQLNFNVIWQFQWSLHGADARLPSPVICWIYPVSIVG